MSETPTSESLNYLTRPLADSRIQPSFQAHMMLWCTVSWDFNHTQWVHLVISIKVIGTIKRQKREEMFFIACANNENIGGKFSSNVSLQLKTRVFIREKPCIFIWNERMIFPCGGVHIPEHDVSHITSSKQYLHVWDYNGQGLHSQMCSTAVHGVTFYKTA